MKTLIILNDAPYGTERSYNGLRLAIALQEAGTELVVFLMADAVNGAKCNQKVPKGYYNIEQLLKRILQKGVVLLCGTCMDARGLSNRDVLPETRRSSMKELAQETLDADKVLVF